MPDRESPDRAHPDPAQSDPTVSILADQLRARPTSGIATYTRGLLRGLQAMGTDAPTVALLASRAPRGEDPLRRWGWPVRSARLPAPLLTRAWDRGWASGITKKSRVLHATSLATPYPPGVPVAVMVHDVAWREVPDTFPARGRRWHEAAFGRCLAHAALVITPSERTAALVREAGMAADRVVAVDEGADHLPAADGPATTALLTGLGVRGPFLLTVSTLEPRKNLSRLMAAYERVRDRLPEPWPLVVVGPPGWGDVLTPVAGVKMAGRVDDAVLAGLYARARCLAYVPLVEGWGLPPVEAMAACTPVVASAMPSTAGAALEVDPNDVDAIGAGLVSAAGDEARRSQLVTAGLLRARELTWERSAREHARLWDNLR